MRKLLALLALSPLCVFGQAFRVDPAPAATISTNVPPGAYPPVLAIPGATISFSGGSTYTDLTGTTTCPSNAPVVLQGTSVCVAQADAEGNFGFYLKAGNYTYTVTTPTGASYGPLTLSVPSGGGGGGGGGGCNPGGASGNIQYNNGSGGCAGNANLTWNTASSYLNVAGSNASALAINASTGFIESATGFLANPGSATNFNSIQAPAGGMEALSFTAANYVQTGQHNGVPSATTADSFHPGAMYYDTGLGAEQIFNGTAWVSVAAGSGCNPSSAAGDVLFSTGSGCGGSDNLSFNTGLQKLTVHGVASTAALDVTAGFIQTEGGIVTNVGSWNAYNTNTDGGVLRGQVIQQNTSNTLGGYINFVPITYGPNGGGTCHDQYGNVVNQPSPLPGISTWELGTATSTFASGATTITLSSLPPGVGVESQVLGLGIARGVYIVGVSGTTITLAFPTIASETATTLHFFNNNLWEWNAPSSSMPDNFSCGTPLPANTLYGMNTNGYYFARGGFATDLPYFNSIQSLYGGVFGRALFTSDLFNGSSGACSVIGQCGGSYYNTGGSNGPPTPLLGDTFHGGAFYWDTSANAQKMYNGSAWKNVCYQAGVIGQILFDNGSGQCGQTSSLSWSGTTLNVTNLSVSGTCTGCGTSAVSSVNGSGNISVSPTTGSVNVSISSSPTWNSQVINGTTNCTASGSTACFQQSTGTFQIFGNGNAAFQTVSANTINSVGASLNSFQSATQFHGGIITDAGSNSSIVIGTGGNLYLRLFSGTINCTGTADGWFGYQTTTNQLWICYGGNAFAH